jgi:hypothetical protein
MLLMSLLLLMVMPPRRCHQEQEQQGRDAKICTARTPRDRVQAPSRALLFLLLVFRERSFR